MLEEQLSSSAIEISELPGIDDRELAEAVAKTKQIRSQIGAVILGKEPTIALVLASLLSGGHVLLEDRPGVGKTVLARALAASISADFQRIQCTPDLMPPDITGYMDPRTGVPKEGPIFANIVLVDELNRAQPRTQSAFLEAMAEKQVSIDGKSYPLAKEHFFFVIATQNPIEHRGVNDLPEAQLDRFQLLLTPGYPDPKHERQMLIDRRFNDPLEDLENSSDRVTLDEVDQLIKLTQRVRVASGEDNHGNDLVKYILDIVQKTREAKDIIDQGASPRAAIQLMQLAKGYALVQGRRYVRPDDIKILAMHALPHRIIPVAGSEMIGDTDAKRKCIEMILNRVPPPGSS